MITRGRRSCRISVLLALVIASATPLVLASGAHAGTLWMWACSGSAFSPDWQHGSTAGYDEASGCPGSGMWLNGSGVTATGSRASWQTTAPSGIAIVHAWVPYQQQMISYGVNDHHLYGGGYFWQGGGSAFGDYQNTYNSPYFSSQYLGVQLICGVSPDCNGTNATPGTVNIENIEVQGEEDSGPLIGSPGAGSLWNAQGWVRGTFPLPVVAWDPSGVCAISVDVDGQALNGPSASPDQSRWQQCPSPQDWSPSIDTASYGDGAIPVALRASNAAYDYSVHAPVSSSVSKTIYVDNEPVALSLSGPTDAPASAGTQYVVASASAGPSGVSSISCSLDGAPPQSYPAATAAVAVQGVGVHHLSCTAFNGARDSLGALGSSPPAVRTLSIREPSVASVSFSRIVGRLRCRRVRERVRIPARWVTARHHGHRVRVRLPAQTRTVRVVHCHPRVVRRRELIHGHWRIVRVVLVPHAVRKTVKRVRFGARTTVSGWLGTTDGNALAGQQVRVMTAAANGLNRFREAAVAITRADGSFAARLPKGPSRLVVAVYGGASTVEPAISGQVRLIVPALVRLRIRPRLTHWWRSSHSPGTIRISGRVLGGYIPGAHQQLLRLRIGVVGFAGVQSTVGIPNIKPNGRFRTTWTPAPGNGTVHFWFSVSTLREADYAFAPASSRRVRVIVR